MTTEANFNMYDDFVFEDSRLKPIHRHALVLMRFSANGPTKMAYPSMAKLALIMGPSRQTVNMAVRHLVKLGYLVKGGGGGNRPVHYLVHLKTQEQIDLELSTGVSRTRHQNDELSTDELSTGVSRTRHLVSAGHDTSVSRSGHSVSAGHDTNLNEVNLIKEEFKEKPFLDNPQSPPPSQNQTPKIKNELLWKSGDPSFGAQKKHIAMAKTLGVVEKQVGEDWGGFILRIRQASKVQHQGAVHV